MPLGPPNAASPWVTSSPLSLFFGVSSFLVPGGLSTLIQTTLSPSPLSLSPPLSPSLLPSPTSLTHPSKTVDVRQLQHHSSQRVRPIPLGQQWLTLMGDKQRRERLNSYPADLGPGPPHCRKLYERDTGSNLMLCSGWKLILPIFSPLFSCCQEKSSWEQAEDSYVPGTSG